MLQLVSDRNLIPGGGDVYGLGASFSEQPEASKTEARNLAQVRICSSVGFEVYGVLKSVSRAGVQVLTPVAVPIRCPLQITIPGCRTFEAEAFYCLKRTDCHQVGIVFTSLERPHLELGALATIQGLAEPGLGARGSVVDVGRSSVSILCKTRIGPGTEVRLESGGWILFGVVKTVVPTSMIGKCLEVHLQAAFRASEGRAGDDDAASAHRTDSRREGGE